MLVRRYGSRDSLGKQIGMSGSRVGRAIDGQYSFNILNCLRLASATGESPSVVLRAAGKNEVAVLIEEMYGKERAALAPADAQHLQQWHALSPEKRAAITTLIGAPINVEGGVAATLERRRLGKGLSSGDLTSQIAKRKRG